MTDGPAQRHARVVRADETQRTSGPGVTLVVGVSAETVGSPQLWFGEFTSEPGVVIPKHFHTCDTAAVLLSGRAVFEIGDDLAERLEMEPGDYCYMPAGVVHTEGTLGDATARFVFARDRAGGETTYL